MSLVNEFLEEKLFNDDMKDKLVEALNESIDIPFISEKTEGKILDSLVSVVFEVFRKAL